MSVRISVITATRNRKVYLERAIESVLAQQDRDVEHIVVDGISTDGTDELLARYPHLVVVSEPDSGVYEAWNKGVRLATGEIVCLLNSDDEIPVGAFAHIRTAMSLNPGVEIISGAVEIDTEGAGPEADVEKRLVDDERILSLREQDVGPGIPITNGRYLARSFFARVGPFDERYRLVSDRDFLLRALLLHPKHVWIREAVYRYHAHAGSLTLSGHSAQEGLAQESLLASRNGLQESRNHLQKAAYRRWHAWALFYVMLQEVLRMDFAAALGTARSGLRLDPLWPLRVPVPLWRHWIERKSRRGRVVG